jgi:hypothetical protein
MTATQIRRQRLRFCRQRQHERIELLDRIIGLVKAERVLRRMTKTPAQREK